MQKYQVSLIYEHPPENREGVRSKKKFYYSIPNNSTSKIKVEPGPITGPAERSP